MSVRLLKSAAPDEGVTHTKLRMRRQQEACYYNRGRPWLRSFGGDVLIVQPWQVGKKEWQKGVVKNRLSERTYEVELHKAFFEGTEFYLWKTSKTAALNDTQRE